MALVSYSISFFKLTDFNNFGSARFVFGGVLLLAHIMLMISSYTALGDFNWSNGDFFVESKGTLRQDGLYYYVKSPELLMLGYWGAALVSYSEVLIFLVLFAQVCEKLYIRYVETPHMIKLYGSQLKEIKSE